MSEKLKQCPLCGSPAEPADSSLYAHCSDCDCALHYVVVRSDAWNDRPERTCRNVYDGREFECSECGMQWHLLDRCDALEEWAHVRNPRYCPECGAKVVR